VSPLVFKKLFDIFDNYLFINGFVACRFQKEFVVAMVSGESKIEQKTL